MESEKTETGGSGSIETSTNVSAEAFSGHEALVANGTAWLDGSAGTKKAPIWAFYDTAVNMNADSIALRCSLCNSKMAYKRKNGSSSLINHVNKKHNLCTPHMLQTFMARARPFEKRRRQVIFEFTSRPLRMLRQVTCGSISSAT